MLYIYVRVYHSNHSFTKNPGGIGVTDRPWGPEKSERLWGRAIRNFIKSHTYTDIICIYMISYIYVYISYIFVTYTCMEHTWMSPIKWRNSHNRLVFQATPLSLGMLCWDWAACESCAAKVSSDSLRSWEILVSRNLGLRWVAWFLWVKSGKIPWW